jgi:hypothetical protein
MRCGILFALLVYFLVKQMTAHKATCCHGGGRIVA